MTILEESILVYIAAWSEIDEKKRRAFLDKCWGENSTYSDPTGNMEGREALSQHIGAFLQRYPGHRFLLTSGVNQHHGWLRFTWVLVKPDGSKLMEGCDFGTTGPDGRLQSVTGFFGPLPPVSNFWPENLVKKIEDRSPSEV